MSGSVVINLFYRLFFIILTDFYITFKNEYKRMFSIKAYEIKKVQKLKVIFLHFCYVISCSFGFYIILFFLDLKTIQ